MTTITSQSVTTAKYWAALVRQTRRFGHTYVHAAARQTVLGWKGITIDGIRYTYCGYGRSVQYGGHKYKVHATNPETGKPVLSKNLP